MNIAKRIILFVVLCILQAFVLNRVALFDIATPLLYAYFLLLFAPDTPKWSFPIWGFALGLINDTFTNTPGVSVCASTLTAFLQPYILNIFISKENQMDAIPSMKTLGIMQYITYSSTLIAIFTIVLYALDAFTTSNWTYTLMAIGGSWLFTMVIILVIEAARKR